MMPIMAINTNLLKILNLKGLKDRATRERLEMVYIHETVGVEESEDQLHSGKRLEDRYMRLVR
eukprot:516866-Amphidinium_carterae.1